MCRHLVEEEEPQVRVTVVGPALEPQHVRKSQSAVEERHRAQPVGLGRLSVVGVCELVQEGLLVGGEVSLVRVDDAVGRDAPQTTYRVMLMRNSFASPVQTLLGPFAASQAGAAASASS